MDKFKFLIITFFIVGISVFSEDFGNLNWGTNKYEIIKNEGTPDLIILNENENLVTYSKTILDSLCRIIYVFDNYDKLVSVKYFFHTKEKKSLLNQLIKNLKENNKLYGSENVVCFTTNKSYIVITNEESVKMQYTNPKYFNKIFSK